MRRVTLLGRVLLWLLCAATARPAMREALTTAQLLSGLIETHLVCFELPDAPTSAPHKVYGVVLTFDNVLWLYTPGLGTRPLGPAPRTDHKSTEIASRLRGLDPALGRVEVFARPVLPATSPMADALHNACFAGCLLHLIELYASGRSVDEAGVIFLGGETAVTSRFAAALGDVGHSLLVYRSAGRWMLFDPANPGTLLPYRLPQIGIAIDPELAAYARQARYPFERVEYHHFSTASLQRLADDVGWRMRSPLSIPSPER